MRYDYFSDTNGMLVMDGTAIRCERRVGGCFGGLVGRWRANVMNGESGEAVDCH